MMNPQHHNPPPYPTSRPTSLLLPPSSSTQQYYPSPSPFPSILTPTGNTPIVMTPNTIKSIEQSILQTLGEDTEEAYMMESQAYSGNFVPPLPSSTSTITLINTWQGGQVSSDMDNSKDEPEKEPEPPQKKQKKVVTPRKKQQKAPPAKKQTPKKSSRPQKPPPTEEDERRKVRRERNKLAAARCRKRRVDHTNKLLQETEGLEDKKRSLQTQITELQNLKEELEFILEAHNCVKKLVKNEVLSDLQNLPSRSSDHKLKRPNTLNVISNERLPVTVSTPAPPIPINTPSTGIAGLGFEPLCSDWGVNTPTPCSEGGGGVGGGEEKRDGRGGSLVTPVNPFKKLQDL